MTLMEAGPGGWRPRWRSLDWGLLLFGGLALFAASPLGQVAAIVSMLVIIGLPIYVILALLPTAFLIYLLLRLAAHGWAAWRAGHFLFAGLFAVLCLAMLDYFVFGAWRENARLDARVAEFRAGDRDEIGAVEKVGPLAKGGTLALVTNSRLARDGENPCTELCQRLLLNGEVRRVLVHVATPVRAPARTGKPDASRSAQDALLWPELTLRPQARGRLYWLQAGAPCGPARIPEDGQLNLPPRGTPERGVSFVRDASAAEAMRVRIANGECLMSADADLAEADAAVVYGTIASASGDFALAHEARADTINAWRVAFLERRDGAFVETYRQTGARYLRFPHARAVSYVHGSEFRMKTGFVRLSAQAGAVEPYANRAGVEAFMLDRLGLKLHLDAQATPAGRQDALARILSAQGAWNEIDAKIVQDYIRHINSNWSRRDYRLAEEDAARILTIAADGRVSVPWEFGGAVALVGRDATASAGKLADLLFARLGAFGDAPADEAGRGASGQGASGQGAWGQGVQSLAASIARLPDDILRLHRAEMVRLSQTPVKRDRARALLAMLDSAADELAQRRERRGADRGAEAYGAALRGLCRLGDSIAFALPMLRERAVQSDAPLLGRHRDLAIAMLARLGAGEEEARALMKVDPADARAAGNFDRAWRKAFRDRPCD